MLDTVSKIEDPPGETIIYLKELENFEHSSFIYYLPSNSSYLDNVLRLLETGANSPSYIPPESDVKDTDLFDEEEFMEWYESIEE